MRNKLRKNYQRKLNKIIKNINKNIENDELWNGRFIFFQHSAEFEIFPDKSGGLLYVIIRAYDKKTGYYKDYFCDYAPYLDLFYGRISLDVVNHFIVEDLKVWGEEIDPRDDKTKYYNKKVDINSINKLSENYYLDSKSFIENKKHSV